jgi:crescentin
MSKISDFLARKTQPSFGEKAPDSPNPTETARRAPDSEPTAERGSRLGAENEALRSLVVDAARKIEDLDTLKVAFGRIIDPLHKTLFSLEQEKSHNASLLSTLGETRAVSDVLRSELQQSERATASLSAANDKLQQEIEQVRLSASGLESSRIELVNEIALKNTEIADLESRLSAESIAHHALADEHRIITDQAQTANKRLSAVEAEIIAARQKLALSEDDRRSLQISLDQTVGEVSRASRQMTESSNALAAAQTRLAQLETSFAEAEAERARLVATLDEAKERHRAEASTQAMRLDALQSRAATAEKLLVEARSNLTARADEVRAYDRKMTDATIARNAAEKRLAQLEGAQQSQERQIKDLEQARAALVERNTALGKSMRARETELARAEEKIQSSNDLIARLEADLQASRGRMEKRTEELNSMLERERMDRAVAEGALEATRKDNARLQRENTRLESSLRQADEAPAAKRGKSNIEPIIKP